MAADPSYNPTEFQEVVRAWMQRNDFSQMDAGNVTGLSQGIINRWLKPRGDSYLVQPTIDSLEKLAAAPGFSVPLIQLKRMTNRLSPDDLAVLSAVQPEPPDHRLDALVSDIRSRWRQLNDDTRQQVEDVNRALLGMHHRRTRRSRENRSQDQGDLLRTASLMVV